MSVLTYTWGLGFSDSVPLQTFIKEFGISFWILFAYLFW